VRNVGGMPMTAREQTLVVSYLNASAQPVQVLTQTKRFDADVAQASTADFGTFMPRTLRELVINDPFYGLNPNVTPVYRFTVTTGTDDFGGNNSYSKDVRFFVQRSGREALVSVENYSTTMPATAVGIANKLNADTLVGALKRISWERADGVNREDYDLFERDKWPQENLSFSPWSTVIWAQGPEPQGLTPEERLALKAMLDNGTSFFRNTLVMAGQDVARLHDVALTASNGMVADQDFVRNYLRSRYLGNTDPAVYERTIKGVAITPGRFEQLQSTGVAGDQPPMPSVLTATPGDGIARASHVYVELNAVPPQQPARVDTAAGMAVTAEKRNVVYYAFDWRHAGRFYFEPDRSGAWRLLLGALDFSNQFRGVLPVKLVSFEAYQSAPEAVTLQWETSSEIDVRTLEIERAEVVETEAGESLGEYVLVDRTGSRGSASQGASYRVVDQGVSSGREYSYRLVTTNLEGARMVERQQRVKLGSTTAAGYSLTVLPNPVTTRSTITVRVPSGERAQVSLYDELGRLVQVLTSDAASTGVLELSAADLASGVYTVRLVSATGVVLNERVTVRK
jgi:hypothetical protein